MSAPQKGRLIVLEGTDGSGKSTQFAKLCQRVQAEGIAFRRLVFPQYQEESSALLRMYLRGEFGKRPEDVNAYAASSFYAVRRLEKGLGQLLSERRSGPVRPVYHLQRGAPVQQGPGRGAAGLFPVAL